MRVYLEVDYHQRKQAKACGARWDGETKRWYADDQNAVRCAQWLPKHLLAPTGTSNKGKLIHARNLSGNLRSGRASHTERGLTTR